MKVKRAEKKAEQTIRCIIDLRNALKNQGCWPLSDVMLSLNATEDAIYKMIRKKLPWF